MASWWKEGVSFYVDPPASWLAVWLGISSYAETASMFDSGSNMYPRAQSHSLMLAESKMECGISCSVQP